MAFLISLLATKMGAFALKAKAIESEGLASTYMLLPDSLSTIVAVNTLFIRASIVTFSMVTP